jgi:hypothetical protein
MPKRKLEELVGEAVAGNGGGMVGTKSWTSEVRESRTTDLPNVGTSGPRYLRLARKDVRLREDQLEALDTAARRLSRHRTDKAERITENTLIRIAVDLLIPRLDGLAGDTEEALLQALRDRAELGSGVVRSR